MGGGNGVSAQDSRPLAHAPCMKAKLLRAWAWVRKAYAVLTAHRYTTIAGTLVFFLLTSVVPFLFWLTLLFGKTAWAGEALLSLAPYAWARELVETLRTSAEAASEGAGVLFLATTLWSSTGFFYHLRRSGEIIYGDLRPKHGWRVRLSALLLTFAVLLYFAAAGGMVCAGTIAVRFLPPVLGPLALFLLLFVTGFLAAWMLNAYICPYRVGPADTLPGSLLTAVCWLAASLAFAVYVRFSAGGRLYGALALVIIFLLFLYWMMICFVTGAIYNRHRLVLRGRARKRL